MGIVSTVIGAIILGAILGYVGKLLVPGRQNIPAWATIGVGFVAALIGGVIAAAAGVGDTRGVDWWKLLIQVGFATAGIALVARMMGGSSSSGARGRAARRRARGDNNNPFR
jgi:hypothetical protein